MRIPLVALLGSLLLAILPATAISATDPEPASALQTGQAALFTFEVNAYDVDWYDNMGYQFPYNTPLFTDPHDLQAEILLNGNSFSPPVHTPYRFGEAGNLPFAPGVYSVSQPGWGEWIPVSVTLDYVMSNYEMDFLGTDISVPVELSSFTADLTPAHSVLLTWVSQSESSLVGYYLLRSESPEIADAQSISSLISATNTSSEQTYAFMDTQIVNGTTYHYWLEVLGFSGNSTYFGPIDILAAWTGIGDAEPPALSETSFLGKAWPNPLHATGSTSIAVSLKAGETGTVGIYNLLGQCVRAFPVRPNTHQLIWDGRDRNGKACSSGVYLYKLDTPSVSQTRKLLLRK